MKMIQKAMGWLVMAAALTIGTTACSSDDTMITEQPTKNVSYLQVTVGAGLLDNATMRSMVEENGTTRTLKLTAGDRLYVKGSIKETNKFFKGFLNIVESSISSDGLSAQFSGTLPVYFRDPANGYAETPTTYTFVTNNPLEEECQEVRGTLAHKNANESFIEEIADPYSKYVSMANSVNELMTTYLRVTGNYNSTTHNFPLSISDDSYNCTPIINCSVTGGLTANATYEVDWGECYDGGKWSYYTAGTITSDGDGKASFALSSNMEKENIYYSIRFRNKANGTDWKIISLGQKQLASKIYKISTAASADPNAPVFPTITGATYSIPDYMGCCYIDGNGGTLNFTISGTSRNVSFEMKNFTSATVTLDGVNAQNKDYFLRTGYDTPQGLTVIVNGNSNTINCKAPKPISLKGNLKLSGNGQLTITASNEFYCGIDASNHNFYTSNYETVTEVDMSSNLAADGYTVTRSARTGDGPYTWTYTVAPVTP